MFPSILLLCPENMHLFRWRDQSYANSPSAANKKRSSFRLCRCGSLLVCTLCQIRYGSFAISQFVNKPRKDSNIDKSFRQKLTCFCWRGVGRSGTISTTKNVKKSLQPTQNSRHTSCLSACMLWHAEFWMSRNVYTKGWAPRFTWEHYMVFLHRWFL